MLSPYIITSALKLNIKYSCKLVARRTNLLKTKNQHYQVEKIVEHKFKKKNNKVMQTNSTPFFFLTKTSQRFLINILNEIKRKL